jgi:peptidoglycan-associated lipoprotein
VVIELKRPMAAHAAADTAHLELGRLPMRMWNVMRFVAVVLMLATIGACAKRQQAGGPEQPPPDLPPPAVSDRPTTTAPPPPVAPPQRVEDTRPVTPVAEEDDILTRSLDDLNRDSPLRPVFFAVDSAELDDAGRAIASANVDIMKKYSSWVVTIEGHCDERGTAEYNLALGERRAQAVRTYMLSLGIPPDRLATISYGKEFPFDAGHDDAAWAKNRRAHFVITSK